MKMRFRTQLRFKSLGVLVLTVCIGCSEPAPVETKSQPNTSTKKRNEASTTPSKTSDTSQSDPAASLPAASEPKSKPGPQISSEAFRLAAFEGRLDSVRSAVESGADIDGTDPARSLTALHMAAYNGHTETVQYLIEKGAKVDCRDSDGKTPLIHACTGPFAKSVEVLIAAGADVNAKDATEGFTPLMMAAGLGQPDVVKVLLSHKADKSVLDEDQESAADHARNSGHNEIVEMLK